jgi:hypothetical protein
MSPTITKHLAEAHIADLRHRASSDTRARAARRGRSGWQRSATPRWRQLCRRGLATLGRRGSYPTPTPSDSQLGIGRPS